MTHDPSPRVTQDHWVYVCRAADGRALYVGVTSCGLRRFAHGHAKTATWWREVASIDVEHLPTRQDALLRERELIFGLEPPHNQALTGGITHRIPREPGPSRWLSTEELADWLSADPAWVQAKVKAGMPHAVIGGAVRFQAEEVRSWLQS